MNIQFSNWQLINLQDYGNAIESIPAGVANTDSTLSQLAPDPIYFYDGNNSTAYGDWFPYELYATGTGFLGGNPVARYIQLSTTVFNNGMFSQELYRLNGGVPVINNGGFYEIHGGNFSSLSHLVGGVADYSVAGSFVYTPIGDIGGGTITSANINNASGKLTLKGNLIIDANEVITSGNVTELSYTSLSGEKFLISNTSFSYTELRDLIANTGGNTDFSAAYNYFLNPSNLNGNDTITAGALDDNLNGYAGNDTLNGGAGINTLDGGAGVDKLNGGLGDDKYIVDLVQTGTSAATFRVALQDTVTEALNAGTNDVLELRGSFVHDNATTLTLGANLEQLDASATISTKLNLTGNALNNTLIGNAANNVLSGGTGAGEDTLDGRDGNDTLDGGLGRDTLIGGAGDDTYLVDIKAVGITPNISVELQDSIDESTGTADDIDTLKLRGSVVIPAAMAATTIALSDALASLENLDVSLTGATRLNLTGNDADNILIGNAAVNTLTGGDGMDFLDGKAGADTMMGGLGVDTYVVDNKDDVVIEQPDEGDLDMINSFISFDLSTKGANVEYLQLAGTAIIGTGNDLNNGIYGNSQANILTGGTGDDDINGALGNDILDGGIGEDDMEGGDGADTYIVDDGGDTVTESNALATGGIDIVKASVDFTLGNNIENLTLLRKNDTDNLSGTGNQLANTITGDAGDNTLNGDAGNDTLNGGLGSDTLIGGAGVDKLAGGKGDDTYRIDLVRSSALATSTVALQDSVSGELANPLNSTVEGIDTIVLTNNTGNAGAPIDTSNITNATTFTVSNYIENFDARLTDNIKLNITGNALANDIKGNNANNIIDGGLNDKKIDTLAGGNGNDTYLVDAKLTAGAISSSFDDIITEDADGGIDTLKLRGSTTLAQTLDIAAFAAVNNNIEGLDISALLGGAKIDLIGDTNDNILVGNAASNIINGGMGNDTLDGGAGNDTLIGGDGDDTYVMNVVTDIIVGETSGSDTLAAAFTANLSDTQYADIENLTLTGTANINATGNGANNLIIGNSGNNILTSVNGPDTLRGGAGNDTYQIDVLGLAIVEENLNQGTDTIITSNSTTLVDNVENLILTGNFDYNLVGNNLNNVITGNTGNNVLEGLGGIDTLKGGKGDDVYYVNLKQVGSGLTAKVLLEDNILENLNEGNDDYLGLFGTFDLAVASTYTLAENFERLSIAGTASTKLNITGNKLNNEIIGNDYGNIIDGGIGADIMSGGLGDDIYSIDNLGDIVVEEGVINGGVDLVKINIALAGGIYNLSENLENATLTNIVAYSIVGNELANTLTGNGTVNTLIGGLGNDVLDGKAGADTLNGGFGDDTYYVDVIKPAGIGGDVIIEDDIALNFGNDTVKTTFSADLRTVQFDGIENLTLLGTALNSIGDDGDNELIGNASANNINGGAGDDEIKGGAGNDILTGGLGEDTFVWSLADKGTNGRPSIDKITDFSSSESSSEDKLDLRDLLVGENSFNISNYLDITTSTAAGITSTEIRISNTGGFASGNWSAAAENQHITLAGVNYLTGTNETDLLASLIAENKLLIDI